METVSIGVIALNEAENLPVLLSEILNQDYPHKLIEIILVDGISNDSTWDIMNDFANTNSLSFLSIRLFRNPKHIQPAAWAIVVDNFKCDCLIRLDAHSRIPKSFVRNNIDCINSGESICGGTRANIMLNNCGGGSELLLIAEKSLFGSGAAKYRNGISKKEYVNTVAHACYKKEVFKKVGNFNELIARAEDNEIHYRMRKAGYKICFDPSIESEYITRPTFKGMVKQKFGNGKWVGITSRAVSFNVFSLFHFIPMLFTMALLISIVLAVAGCALSSFYFFICLIAVLGSYTIVNLFVSFKSAKESKKISIFFRLPFLFLVLHLSYGIGTLFGLLEFSTIRAVRKQEKRCLKND